MAAASAGHGGAGTMQLVLPDTAGGGQAHQQQQPHQQPQHAGGGEASTSASHAKPPAAHITESVTLRLVPRRKKKSVKWAEDVAEINEDSGKRKSKKCCIFHRRRQFGDWSDDDDSDMECDCDPDQGQQQQQHSGGGGGGGGTHHQQGAPQPQ